MDFGEVMKAFSEDTQFSFLDGSHLGGQVEDFAIMYQLFSAGVKQIRTKLEILDSEFMFRNDHDPIHHMEYRLKSPKSIAEKLKKNGLELTAGNAMEHVQDIAGIRVICSFLEDIYHVSGLLLSQKDVELVRKKDYIISPKDSGYRSLHLVVSIPVFLSDHTERVNVEIQFRTIAMDFWASLEHQLKYKSNKNIPEHLRQELYDCAGSIADLDSKMQAIHQKIDSFELDNAQKSHTDFLAETLQKGKSPEERKNFSGIYY